MEAIKALTFDTGGTILDWHTGISGALAAAGGGTGWSGTGRRSPTITGPVP